jgi:hypothetical protein
MSKFPEMEYKRQPRAEDDVGPVETSLELFQKVYQNPNLPLPTRMRAAIAAKDHEHPKLGVTINVHDDGSFAAQLDAAIRRSNGSAKVIEHQAEGSPTSEANQVSREHQRQPIKPYMLTRRV